MRFHIVLILLALSFGPAHARIAKYWTFQELTEAADVIVIAQPITTERTQDTEALEGMTYQSKPIQAKVNLTKFKVRSVLKGELGKELMLRHLRRPEGLDERERLVVYELNGPCFVKFEEASKKVYLMFLKKTKSGHYIAVSGQIDPDQSIDLLRPEYIETSELKLSPRKSRGETEESPSD